MSVDQPDFVDMIDEANDEFRTPDNLDEAMFEGGIGFHTFYNPEGPASGQYGPQTALHAAFEELTEEIVLDPRIVEENQGEVTPATIATEFREQWSHFGPRGDRFGELLAEELEAKLRMQEGRDDGH